MLAGRVGADQGHVDAAHGQGLSHAADVHLFAVENPVAVDAFRFAACGPHDVGAAARLGGGDAQEGLAGGHARQDLGLELRCRVTIEDEAPGRLDQIQHR